MKISSHIATIARGSVAGITYSANQFSKILARSKPIPSQPHSNNQTLLRSGFTAASHFWNYMSAECRSGWDDYADTLSYPGPLGPYKLPGRLVFISNYSYTRYLFQRGQGPFSVFLDPPVIPGFLTLERLNIYTPPSSDIGYRIAGFNRHPSIINVAIWNSRFFNPSRLRHSGPWKSDQIFGDNVDPTSHFSFDITGLIPDKRYFCVIRASTTNTPHRLSQQYFFNTIAEEAPPGYIIPPLPPEVTP